MAIDTGRMQKALIDRINAAGGLPLPDFWPGTSLRITTWEMSLIREAQEYGLLPAGPILKPLPGALPEEELEAIPHDEPADLPYEVTPAVLALRERKMRLGR